MAANLCGVSPVNEARQPTGSKLIYFGAGQSTKGENAGQAGCILKKSTRHLLFSISKKKLPLARESLCASCFFCIADETGSK